MNKPKETSFIKHLKSLGYVFEANEETSEDNDLGFLVASHKIYRTLNMGLNWWNSGLFGFTEGFAATIYARENKNEFIAFINDLNQKSLFTIFHTSPEKSGILLIAKAIYTGSYNKEIFNKFVRKWYEDTSNDGILKSHPSYSLFFPVIEAEA